MTFLRTIHTFARQSLSLLQQSPTYAQHGRPTTHFKGTQGRIAKYKTFPFALNIIATGILMGYLISESDSNGLYEHYSEQKRGSAGSKNVENFTKSSNVIAGLKNDARKIETNSVDFQQQCPENSTQFA